VLLPLLIAAALHARAAAFSEPAQFLDRAGQPHAATLGESGEGIYFTGAPRFARLTCRDCHAGGPEQVRLRVGADQAELFTSGYTPGQTYQLEVELLDEQEGLTYDTPTCTEVPSKTQKFTYVQCNQNSYGLEIDTASGPLGGPGVFCASAPGAQGCPAPDPSADESVVTPSGDAVFGNRAHSSDHPEQLVRNDPTRWHLWWTAPTVGTGPLTLYVAVVDGNGGSGTVDNDQDPQGDDTVQASIPLQEAGATAPPAAAAGCAVDATLPPTGVDFVLTAAVAWLSSRRRRSSREIIRLLSDR
jgi:hypothetical protein